MKIRTKSLEAILNIPDLVDWGHNQYCVKQDKNTAGYNGRRNGRIIRLENMNKIFIVNKEEIQKINKLCDNSIIDLKCYYCTDDNLSWNENLIDEIIED